MRDDIIFRCTECGNENYIGTKNKRNHPDRMEIKKYCKKCNKKTVQKEKKKGLPYYLFEKSHNKNGDYMKKSYLLALSIYVTLICILLFEAL